MIGGNILLTYNNVIVEVKKCHEDAVLPTQANGDVGFDLSCVEDFTLRPGEPRKIKTGLMLANSIEPVITDNKIVAVPFLKIEGRSGLASKGIFPVGGILDPRYRGEIVVVLVNVTQHGVDFKVGDRIAQLVCYYTLANCNPYLNVKFVEANNVSESTRGENGFGSSGA